jgi:hypothetical protein
VDDLDLISPELALVCPELRARAIAALPPIELDRRAPLPPLRSAPQPRARLPEALAGIAVTSLLAFVACVGVVLAMTEVANAVR